MDHPVKRQNLNGDLPCFGINRLVDQNRAVFGMFRWLLKFRAAHELNSTLFNVTSLP